MPQGGFSRISGFYRRFCRILLCSTTRRRSLHGYINKLIGAPWFKLEQIEITGLEQPRPVEILNAMGLERGQCTLNIGIGQVAERLKKLPAVRQACVRFESRGHIVAEIVEREPAAIVRCGGKDMQMDIEGILFSEAAPDEKRPLPLITGLCDSNIKLGDSVPQRSLGPIRELLSAIDSSKSWLAGNRDKRMPVERERVYAGSGRKGRSGRYRKGRFRAEDCKAEESNKYPERAGLDRACDPNRPRLSGQSLSGGTVSSLQTGPGAGKTAELIGHYASFSRKDSAPGELLKGSQWERKRN